MGHFGPQQCAKYGSALQVSGTAAMFPKGGFDMFSSRLPLVLANMLFTGLGVGSAAWAADESIHHLSAAV